MKISATLRAMSYLAADILPALRRLMEPVEDGDPYADHLAKLHADALAEREAQVDVSEPQKDCGLGEADECLCDPDGGLSCDACSSIADIGAEAPADQLSVGSILRSGGKTSEMGPHPKLYVAQPPSAADEPACDCRKLEELLTQIATTITQIDNRIDLMMNGPWG